MSGMRIAFRGDEVFALVQEGWGKGKGHFTKWDATQGDVGKLGEPNYPPTWQWPGLKGADIEDYSAMIAVGDLLVIGTLRHARSYLTPAAGEIVCLSAKDGVVLNSLPLERGIIHNGLAAAGGKLYATLASGEILCLQHP